MVSANYIILPFITHIIRSIINHSVFPPDLSAIFVKKKLYLINYLILVIEKIQLLIGRF